MIPVFFDYYAWAIIRTCTRMHVIPACAWANYMNVHMTEDEKMEGHGGEAGEEDNEDDEGDD